MGGGDSTPLTIFGADLELWSSGLRSGGSLRDTGGASGQVFDPLSSAPAPVGAWRVEQINDISGKGRDFLQATTSHQVNFDQATGELNGFTNNTHFDPTAFAVSQPYSISFVLTMPNPTGFRIVAESFSTFRRMRAFSSASTFNCGSDVALATSALTDGQRYRFICVVNGGSGEIFVDGVSDATGNTGVQDFDNGMTWFNANAFNLGWLDEMSEIVMASGVPTAQQVADLDAYFVSEWGF